MPYSFALALPSKRLLCKGLRAVEPAGAQNLAAVAWSRLRFGSHVSARPRLRVFTYLRDQQRQSENAGERAGADRFLRVSPRGHSADG